MKNKQLIIGIIIIGLIAFGIWMQICSKQKGKELYQEFNNAQINDTLVKIDIAYNGTKITLSSGKCYVFYPRNSSYDGRRFSSIASSGNLILKEAKSDTLQLHSHDGTFYFTFRKLE